jgi:type I restriction enzyme, S subunit
MGDEASNEKQIPPNWRWAKIREVGDVVSGGTPSTSESSYWGNDINWLSPADLTGYSAKYIKKGAKSLTQLGLVKSSAKLMPAGSIHFSSRAPIGYVAISKEDISTNQGFKSLVPANGIFNEYVYYYFKFIKHYANSIATGTTFKELSGSAFSGMPFPIAPTNEQYRIVDKIEELFSEIDKGVESLKTAKAQLQVYRQALLKYAFEGKLTAQWRSDNPDKVVPAAELLRSIEQAREERYQQQLTDWQTAIEKWEFNGKEGKKPSQPRKIKPVFSLATEDCLKLPNLPFTWQWVSFEELLISIRGGTTVPPVDYPTEYSILRSSSVRIGSINYSDVRYLAPDQVKNSLDFVESRDLLFSRLNGSIEFVGNCALVNALHSSKLKLLYPDRLYCAKLLNHTLGKYCELYFASPSVRRSIENKAKSTAGHKRISITDITEMPIPLIGIDEAEQLVNYLEEKITTAIENEKQIDLNIRRTEMLRQSILKKAFSGQLVPQDPTDEPASQLLKRIQAEKANRETATKTKRKSTNLPRQLTVLRDI